MRVIPMSQIMAILSALTLAAACNDAYSPSPYVPNFEGLTVIPRSASLQAGQVVMLHASFIDDNGDPLPATFSWRSSDESVATVAATGEVFGRAPGRAIITASVQNKSQTAAIHVLPRVEDPDSEGGKSKPNMDPARL
jgi:hypothetical protein